MAERVVKVTLSAQVEDFKRGMREAAESIRTVGTEAEKFAQQKQSFQTIGAAALAAGAVVATGVGMAVAKFVEFDQAMSNVQAATHESADNMAMLREAAIEAGARTVYSASEAAAAIEELSKAGVSTSDVLAGGLSGALDLAAAGEIAVADAAEIAASAMTQFGLAGSDVTHIADLLAAGAGKAQGGVSDLSQALNQSGLVASQMGLSLEETVGTLSLFASAGMMGSDAGTSFRNMLLRLANPTDKARSLMDELGLTFYDTRGEFIGMEGVADQLTSAFADLTQEERNAALANLFGQDAIRAAAILYEGGASAVEEWTAAVDESGYAAETAATRLDNLAGDWEALGGAVDSALISMGEAADGSLRWLVQSLTGAVDAFNEMPAPAQHAAFWIGGVAAAGSLAFGTYLLLVPKIAEFYNALDVLGPKAQAAARHVGTLARGAGLVVGIGLAVAGVDALSHAIAENLLPSAEQIDNKMRSASSGVELFAAALTKEGIGDTRQAADLMGNLAAQLDAVADSSFWNPASISGTAVTVAKELAEIANSGDMALFSAQFRQLAEDAGLSERQLRTFIKTNPELQDALTQQATNAGLAADAQTLLEIAMGRAEQSTADNTAVLRELQGQAASTGDEIEDLADTIRGFGSATLNARDAQRQFEQALDDLQASIDENGSSLDITTEKGRANEQAIDDLVKSTLEFAASIYEQTGSQEEANGVMATGRERLIAMLDQFGITGEAADAYADKLGLIPENIDTYVAAHTSDAQAAVDAFIWSNSQKRINIAVGIGGGGGLVADNFAGNLYDRGVQQFYAGGFASGIYSGKLGGIHKFAESEMGVPWETYISGRAADRSRNIGIWQETGRRLGVADGPSADAIGSAVAASIARDVKQLASRPVVVMLPDGRVLAAAVNEANSWG